MLYCCIKLDIIWFTHCLHIQNQSLGFQFHQIRSKFNYSEFTQKLMHSKHTHTPRNPLNWCLNICKLKFILFVGVLEKQEICSFHYLQKEQRAVPWDCINRWQEQHRKQQLLQQNVQSSLSILTPGAPTANKAHQGRAYFPQTLLCTSGTETNLKCCLRLKQNVLNVFSISWFNKSCFPQLVPTLTPVYPVVLLARTRQITPTNTSSIDPE